MLLPATRTSSSVTANAGGSGGSGAGTGVAPSVGWSMLHAGYPHSDLRKRWNKVDKEKQ
jgi:hypothetical protein